jgi:hypothetical protein
MFACDSTTLDCQYSRITFLSGIGSSDTPALLARGLGAPRSALGDEAGNRPADSGF